MGENLDLNLTVQAWADIVIQIWLDKIEKLHIYDTYQLADSFVNHIITHANGDAYRIEFAFNYYGKFIDMGVGRGVKLEDAGDPNSKRKPRPWYSKTFFSEVQKLRIIFAEKYARKGAILIVENIDDNAEVWNERRL